MGQNTKQRPELSQKLSLTEIETAQSWLEDQRVYRIVVPLTGGNGSSVSAAVPVLNGLAGVVTSARGVSSVANGFQAGQSVTVLTSTGVVTWTHTGDLTGEDVYAVVEYTKG